MARKAWCHLLAYLNILLFQIEDAELETIGFIQGYLFNKLWEEGVKYLELHLCLWLRVRNGCLILLWKLFVGNLILSSYLSYLNQDSFVQDWILPIFALVFLRWIKKWLERACDMDLDSTVITLMPKIHSEHVFSLYFCMLVQKLWTNIIFG